MSSFRILIADDHEVVRKGLRSLLESHPGWEVCAEAVDGWEAVRKAEQLNPDLIALDIAMPNLNGLDAAQLVRRKQPQAKILFLTMYDTGQVLDSAMEIGAQGLVQKSDAGRDLVAAVEALQQGSTFFACRVRQSPPTLKSGRTRRLFERDSLTLRERQVVQLLAEGKSTKQVASVLGVSVKTADTHRSNIMRKLGFHSEGEVVLYALRNNIVRA